jgi:branched-subunit amino acid aminotransferase/4-amino-4-deoxychorismate lyase
MVSGGIVHTPPLSAGILPGIARARILGLLGPSLSRERRITLAEILEAEEVFVTNALVGVMPVVRIDLRTFDATANPATRGLAEALRREMTANIEAK